MSTLKDYECPKCKTVFEKKTKYDETVICKKCGEQTYIIFKKVPTIIYKGTGFHSQDYDKHGPYYK